MSFAVVVRHRVPPDAASRIAFEAIYGPGGEWAGFFAQAGGYKGNGSQRRSASTGGTYLNAERLGAFDPLVAEEKADR